MKFIVALTMLASVSAFAQRGGHDDDKIKCWESAQGHRGRPAYIFEFERDRHMNFDRQLELVFPFHLELHKKRDCWVGKDHMSDFASRDEFEVCEGEGQRINGLVPVEIDEENFEGTVYCEREIKDAFRDDHDHEHDDMN